MSPEPSQGTAVAGRRDLLSLGTVLYEMIAGNNPFAAATVFEPARRVPASEYPPFELLREGTPQALSDVVVFIGSTCWPAV